MHIATCTTTKNGSKTRTQEVLIIIKSYISLITTTSFYKTWYDVWKHN